jgi:DNA repair exonuclease SbcCD nuclease subunit
MRGRVPEGEVYKAAFVSDVHMRNDWPYSTPTGRRHRTDRFEDQLDLWAHIGTMAHREGCDRIYVLGDLFDRPLVDPVTMAGTVAALRKVAEHTPISILPGNHDEHKTGSFQTEVFGEIGGERIQLLDHAQEIRARDWLRFWPYHYRKEGIEAELKEHADYCAGLPRRATELQEVALIHQSIKGCSHLGWVCDDGLDPELLGSFKYTLAGHFHDHQWFIKKRGMYLGAPMHHHFGDVGRQAQYWIIKFTKGKAWAPTPVDPELPHFFTTDWDEDYEGLASKGDFLRIDLHKTQAEIEELRDAIAEVKEAMRADGIRAHVKPHPIYHHGARLRPDEGSTEVFTIDDMIVPYVEHPSVSTDGLDEERLISMGKRFLAEARSDA